MFPKFIHFKSSDSVTELTDVVVENKRSKDGKIVKLPPVGVYVYRKSLYHVDDKIKENLPVSVLRLSELQIESMISKNTITTTSTYDNK